MVTGPPLRGKAFGVEVARARRDLANHGQVVLSARHYLQLSMMSG
jgi:hypothetical protein